MGEDIQADQRKWVKTFRGSTEVGEDIQGGQLRWVKIPRSSEGQRSPGRRREKERDRSPSMGRKGEDRRGKRESPDHRRGPGGGRRSHGEKGRKGEKCPGDR